MKNAIIHVLLGFALYMFVVGPPVQTPPQQTVTSTTVHYYGIARVGPSGWFILDDANHTPSGLTSAYCMPTTGELQIAYQTPLVEVGVAQVSVDETYAGKVVVGASVGLPFIYITFKKIDGTVLPCWSSLLNLPNSNIFVEVEGTTA